MDSRCDLRFLGPNISDGAGPCRCLTPEEIAEYEPTLAPPCKCKPKRATYYREPFVERTTWKLKVGPTR